MLRRRKAPEPICDHESGKLVCAKCQREIDRMAAKLAGRSEVGRQMQRRLAVYGNWPKRPEITGG